MDRIFWCYFRAGTLHFFFFNLLLWMHSILHILLFGHCSVVDQYGNLAMIIIPSLSLFSLSLSLLSLFLSLSLSLPTLNRIGIPGRWWETSKMSFPSPIFFFNLRRVTLKVKWKLQSCSSCSWKTPENSAKKVHAQNYLILQHNFFFKVPKSLSNNDKSLYLVEKSTKLPPAPPKKLQIFHSKTSSQQTMTTA